MSFRLKIAPSRFQRYLNQVLIDFICDSKIVVYMDDILVSSVTREQHFAILTEIFKVANRLQLRMDKCKFLQTEVEFTGYIISEKGISPIKEGIVVVQKIPVLKNTKEVRRFIALCSYFCKFIRSFAIVVKSLYMIYWRKTLRFVSERRNYVHLKLKKKLIEAPILMIYNLHNETELHCDASIVDFGTMLLCVLQRGGNKEFHPVFFFSQNQLLIPKHDIIVSNSKCYLLYMLYDDSKYI